jgi:hypothetical protein
LDGKYRYSEQRFGWVTIAILVRITLSYYTCSLRDFALGQLAIYERFILLRKNKAPLSIKPTSEVSANPTFAQTEKRSFHRRCFEERKSKKLGQFVWAIRTNKFLLSREFCMSGVDSSFTEQ